MFLSLKKISVETTGLKEMGKGTGEENGGRERKVGRNRGPEEK